jgi:hypothetical protein
MALALFGGEINIVVLLEPHATCKEKYHGAYSFVTDTILNVFFVIVVIICTAVLVLIRKHDRRNRLRRIQSIRSELSAQLNNESSYIKVLASFIVYVVCNFLTTLAPIVRLVFMPEICNSFQSTCVPDDKRAVIDSSVSTPIFVIEGILLFSYYRLIIDPIVTFFVDKKLQIVMKISCIRLKSSIVHVLKK